jgi:hypothetical protein
MRLGVAESNEKFAARQAIVRTAMAFLDGGVDLFDAARVIARHAVTLEADAEQPDLMTFYLIDDDAERLPRGVLLEEWHANLREMKRAEVEAYRAANMPLASEAAARLVRDLGAPA